MAKVIRCDQCGKEADLPGDYISNAPDGWVETTEHKKNDPNAYAQLCSWSCVATYAGQQLLAGDRAVAAGGNHGAH